MFTGIIEELGEVVASARPATVLRVRSRLVAQAIGHGASVAVDGVCLTVVRAEPDGAAWLVDFDVMGETLRRSTLGGKAPTDLVNLERPVRADGRLDGHVVQGHVDGVSTILARTPAPGWESVRFSLGPGLARYVAEKGSITVNGVSLTVSDVSDVGSAADAGWFEVGLIPQTLRATNLGSAPPGTLVNVEVDVLAKYAERLLSHTPQGVRG